MPLKPNVVILLIFFHACAELANDQAKKRGKAVLQQLPQAFLTDVNLMTSAINMLMKFGEVTDAEKVFHSMTTKNIVTYGAMMKGNQSVLSINR
jgi:pentatricopeptide repeat protein